MFFDPESLASAWAFKDVKDQCRMTCDSAKDDAFVTHTENGIKKFEESRDGLHCYKLPAGCKETVKEHEANKKRVSFVKKLEENKRRCTTQEFN